MKPLTKETIEMVRRGLLNSEWCGFSKRATVNALCDLALKGLGVAQTLMVDEDVMLSQQRRIAELEQDAARLDFLEREANEDPLLLHSLEMGDKRRSHRGLGLKCTGRSLRKAIDDCRGLAAAIDKGTVRVELQYDKQRGDRKGGR